MSRREFLKWFFLLLSLIAASLAVLWILLQKLIRIYGTRFQRVHAMPEFDATPVSVSAAAEKGVPAGKGKRRLAFFVLSDLHLSRYDPSPAEHFRWAIEDILELDAEADAVFITGDLTDFGLEEEYEQFRNLAASYPLPPVYALMGNHDYYHVWLDARGRFRRETMPNGKTDEESRRRFMRAFGLDKVYQDVILKGTHFFLLSQETYRQERPEVLEGAWYSHAQFQWLRERLSVRDRYEPLFVFIHQPLPPPGKKGEDHQMIRAELFREIVRPFSNLFVFSGHTHLDFKYASAHYSNEETFHWFKNSSVGKVLDREGRQTKYEKDLAQGYYVEVYEHAVLVRGREFSSRQWYEGARWEIPLNNKFQQAGR